MLDEHHPLISNHDQALLVFVFSLGEVDEFLVVVEKTWEMLQFTANHEL